MPDAPPEGGDEGFEADVAARVKAKLDRLHELAERAKVACVPPGGTRCTADPVTNLALLC